MTDKNKTTLLLCTAPFLFSLFNSLALSSRSAGQKPAAELPLLQESLPGTARDQKPKVAFTIVQTSTGKRPDGFRFSNVVFKGSDGGSVIRHYVDFKSADQAKHEMGVWLGSALEKLRSSPELDEAGHEVGQRVLARFRPDEKNSFTVKLIWTNDVKFRVIMSDSLEDVLELERQQSPPTSAAVSDPSRAH